MGLILRGCWCRRRLEYSAHESLLEACLPTPERAGGPPGPAVALGGIVELIKASPRIASCFWRFVIAS